MADQAQSAGRAPAAPAEGAADAEDIKPYKIHVSTKYLDLTKQKLELTRLPHESRTARSEDWWEPKPLVEPLIDFWLEKFSWRAQEAALNSSLPQFRTAFSVPAQDAPLRLHFVHVRSRHANAVPLLLIPPFPFTNLSFGHLVKPLTDPDDVENNQPFHLVIPALPGLGFSDALPNNTLVISTISDILDTLMARLSYHHYLASNAGPGASSPAQIDWLLLNYLATAYSSSCVGAHFISPPLAAPKLAEAPIEWAKWSIANFFHVPMLGYSGDDFSALDSAFESSTSTSTSAPPAAAPSAAAAGAEAKSRPTTSAGRQVANNVRKRFRTVTPAQFGLNEFGLREPNTLAYALCDSPIGLLVFVLKGLRTLSSPRADFTSEQIVTLANLAWLPGPEYAMRLWARCSLHPEEKSPAKPRKHESSGHVVKPRVAITVFLGGNDESMDSVPAAEEAENSAQASAAPAADVEQAAGARVGEGAGVAAGAAPGAAAGPAAGSGKEAAAGSETGVGADVGALLPHAVGYPYSCPAWGNARYEVVFAQRTPGKAGLLAWERPEVIADGVRGLAKEILRLDKRLQPVATEPDTAALESVVVGGDSGAEGSTEGGSGVAGPVPAIAVPRTPTETALPSAASPILATIKESLNEPADQGRLQLPLRPIPLSASASGSGSGSDFAKMTLGTSSGTLLESPRPQTLEGETPPVDSKDDVGILHSDKKHLEVPAVALDKVEVPPCVTELRDVESPGVHAEGFESPAPQNTGTDVESAAPKAGSETKAAPADADDLAPPAKAEGRVLHPVEPETKLDPPAEAEKPALGQAGGGNLSPLADPEKPATPQPTDAGSSATLADAEKPAALLHPADAEKIHVRPPSKT